MRSMVYYEQVNAKNHQKTDKETTMNRYEELEALLESLKDDFEKFFDVGNKAAGTRIRKGMLELKDKAQEIRKEVQEIKNQ